MNINTTNFIDILFAISIIILLFTIIIIFIRGKKIIIKNRSNLLIKLLPLLLVLFTISSVLYLNYYYKNQYKMEVKKFILTNQFNNNSIKSIDSLIVSNNSRKPTLDSLKARNKELNDLLNKIEKQEKILGEKSSFIEDVKRKIGRTSFEIEKIESYNEIVDKEIVLKNRKGYIVSGNTSNFEFYCPSDSISDYIDLKLKFQDESLVSKIGYMYIEVVEDKNKNHKEMVFDQTYLPKTGINAFKIRNYLKQPNMILLIGYVLKSELIKDTPNMEKVTCYSYRRQ